MTITEQNARQNLQRLLEDFNALTDEMRAQMSEASVVRQFIDRLLEEVLGWPIKDPERYKYELVTQVGRPDLTLIPERGGTIFIEAKRFGVIKELKQARNTLTGTVTPGQLSLPGMAVDRTVEEQQAINYAFQNNGTWAILTNFEKLRLFNARRDWLVLSFENPDAYQHDFDLLWQLAYHNVINGSLDALSNQRLRENVDTDYLNFINEWRERLAQDIVTRTAQNPWAFHDDGGIRLAELRRVVQRFLDRLVVVRFAEDHLVIPPGTLRDLYELRRSNPYTFTMDEFLDRFFRQFDENHNSALFAPDLTDQASFSDGALLPLIDKLYEARYRSMPADIIGNTYEQYLGKALVLDNGSVTTRDNLETRKKQGSYYTPQVIVRHIVDHSLGRTLYGTANGKPDGEPVEGETRQTSSSIRELRVLDSACGSGSFLIYAYYVLADFYERERTRLETQAESRRKELAASGMTNPLDLQIELTPYLAELERIHDYPRLILETHLYGVDLDPQAAEIAVVNLMMRAMERRHLQKRLPLILNQNVKVGNSLVGLRPDDPALADCHEELAEIRRLRLAQVSTPHGPEQDAIIAQLREKTDRLNAELDAPYAERFSDMERVRPFHWGVEFPEVFYDADGQPLENPGFSIIFGNPPWEIVKPDLREFYAQFDERIESRLNRKQAEARIAELNAEAPRREHEWNEQVAYIEESAAYFRASDAYTRQGRGDTATHKLFMERMYTLLCDGGRLGYVVPSGIYSDLGTKELREMLLDEGHIQYLYSFSNERWFFPGVHHAFHFTLLGAQKGVADEGFWATFRFNPRVAVAPDDLPDFLADENNLVYVRRNTLEHFSPNSLSVMEFQTKQDYEVAAKIYDDWPLLGQELDESWNLAFAYEFHMSGDSHLFNQNKTGLPLYEGKMIHQFDSYFAEPRYWIDEQAGIDKLKGGKAETWFRGYRFAYREVSSTTNERTCIATVLPPNTFAGHTLWVGVAPDTSTLLYYVAIINSFCIDWLVRFKGGTHVTLFLMKSLPVPRLTAGDPYFDAIVPRAARLTCTRPEFAGLWEDVMGEGWTPPPKSPSPQAGRGTAPEEAAGQSGRLAEESVLSGGLAPTEETAWSGGAGLSGGLAPTVDPVERQRLRDEIDALVAHLYGLSRDEFAHILGTFPLVFPNTAEGAAKKAALLGVYEAVGS